VQKLGWENYIKGDIEFEAYDFEGVEVVVDLVSSVQGVHREGKESYGVCRVQGLMEGHGRGELSF